MTEDQRRWRVVLSAAVIGAIIGFLATDWLG
jgi:hypothetical protein